MNSEAYKIAQSAIANLKSAVYLALDLAGAQGTTNAELGPVNTNKSVRNQSKLDEKFKNYIQLVET